MQTHMVQNKRFTGGPITRRSSRYSVPTGYTRSVPPLCGGCVPQTLHIPLEHRMLNAIDGQWGGAATPPRASRVMSLSFPSAAFPLCGRCFTVWAAFRCLKQDIRCQRGHQVSQNTGIRGKPLLPGGSGARMLLRPQDASPAPTRNGIAPTVAKKWCCRGDSLCADRCSQAGAASSLRTAKRGRRAGGYSTCGIV